MIVGKKQTQTDTTAIKGALQSQVNIKLAEAQFDQECGNVSEAANGRRIANEWQKVVDGNT